MNRRKKQLFEALHQVRDAQEALEKPVVQVQKTNRENEVELVIQKQ